MNQHTEVKSGSFQKQIQICSFKTLGVLGLGVGSLAWTGLVNAQTPVVTPPAAISAEASIGIPPEQWTDDERTAVAQIRDQYTRQGLQLTDAQAAQTVLRMREAKARLLGGLAANRAVISSVTNSQGGLSPAGAAAPPIASAVGTEATIGQRVAALGTTGGPWQIADRKEGFSVNGRPYLDPEGAIAVYNADVLTGYITYTAKTPTGYVIKETRAGTADPAVVLATGQKTAAGWDFMTQSGQRLTGTQFSPLPNGFLVIRGGSGFRYTPGKGVSSITAPDGYVLATLQRGNVDGTGFVLVEKDQSLKKHDLSETVSAFTNIFSSQATQDYALMEIGSGRLFPLSISIGGKDVSQMSNCHKKNSLMNSCDTVDTFESLYQPNGFRNYGHYYWRVNWFNTPSGPVAVSVGGELGSSLLVTDLRSGKQVVAKHRGLGIGDWDATQQPDGDITIVAKMGFSTETLNNATQLLTTDVAAVPAAQATATETAGSGTTASTAANIDAAASPSSGTTTPPAQ